jgi:hypothetical protein
VSLGYRRNLIARNVAVASDTQVGSDPTRQGFLPALKDRVSAPDHR